MNRNFGTKFPTTSSLIIAVGLYFLALVFLFYKMSSIDEAKQYTDLKDSFMDVFVVSQERSEDIVSPKKNIEKPKEPEKIIETPQETKPKKEEIKEEIVKEKEKPKEEKKENIQDVFKNIKITKPVKKENKQETSSRQLFDSINKDITNKAPATQAKGEFDEYKGKINRLIQEKWSLYRVGSANNAKVKVFIDRNGNVKYKITTLTYDADFNDKVRDFLMKLSEDTLPPPPDGVTFSINLTLTDEVE